MSAPRWAVWLLRRLTREDRADDLIGDLEEAHGERLRRGRGRFAAAILTSLEGLDVARAVAWARIRDRQARISWIDLKLGVRMLVKSPGLTVVGVVAIAFGIAIGSVVFQAMTDLYWPRLGLDDSERIVELEQAHRERGSEMRRTSRDLVVWREELESVVDVSAYRTTRRNLGTTAGTAGPVTVAEISASAFRLARVPPLHGRTLVEVDELPGGPPVVVLGYETWQSRFDADPGVVGGPALLSGVEATVVGVMPEGFEFPLSHGAWTPLRLDPLAYAPGEGPVLDVFGRLAPGATVSTAQAEMTGLGARMAADFPETHAELRPFVRPYRGGIINGPELLLRGGYTGIILLPVLILALLCANIALMVFARTAARESEIVVRTALGASRARVVLQLFLEALVLASVGSAVGVLGGNVVTNRLMRFMEASNPGAVPYWFHDALTPTTVLYVAVLTVLGALVVGVLPALRVTREGMRSRLASATAGGGGGRMKGVWTAVIATQIAVTVNLVPFVGLGVYMTLPALRPAVEFDMGRYLTVDLGADDSAPTLSFRAAYTELKERLATEPGVSGVTVASQLPGTFGTFRRLVLEGLEAPSAYGYSSPTASVDADYFDVLGVAVLTGRTFDAQDLESGARVVVVNEGFVQSVLRGQNAIGRRLRFPTPEQISEGTSAEEADWHEIIGVVHDGGHRVGMTAVEDDTQQIYLPLGEPGAFPVAIAIAALGDPSGLAPSVRSLVSDVDPSLQIYRLGPLDEAVSDNLQPVLWAVLFIIVSAALALLLSNAGIYSAMAFAVSRRTREIGVRVALGAGARRIVTTILGHSFLQITLGVLLGGALHLSMVLFASGEGLLWWQGLSPTGAPDSLLEILIGTGVYLAVMAGVCTLACLVPTRRALAVEPTEALKAEG